MAQVETYKDGIDRLTDYVWLYLSRLEQRKDERNLLPEERELLAYVRRTGDLSPVVAEALKLMATDLYGDDEDEMPCFGEGRPRALDHDEALALVKEHGSLRVAARVTGISKSALGRAAQQKYVDYTRKAA